MRALTAVAFALLVGPAAAHGAGDGTTAPEWTFDAWILVPLLALAVPYAAGAASLALRVRGGRTMLLRVGAFAAGWLALSGALVSPLHRLGEHLFTFHMIEHEVLMAVAAPMLVAARPLGMMLWGLPRRLRREAGGALRRPWLRAAWRWLTRGTNATVLHAAAIWGWHAPIAFDAAVTSASLHRLQHLSFFLTAVLFWWSVLWRSDRGVAAWHLFVTMMHTAALGALMVLAPRVLYVGQTESAARWGLTPLEDQQLAGLVMWIPAGTVYAGAALAMAALWISRSSQGAKQVGYAAR